MRFHDEERLTNSETKESAERKPRLHYAKQKQGIKVQAELKLLSICKVQGQVAFSSTKTAAIEKCWKKRRSTSLGVRPTPSLAGKG